MFLPDFVFQYLQYKHDQRHVSVYLITCSLPFLDSSEPRFDLHFPEAIPVTEQPVSPNPPLLIQAEKRAARVAASSILYMWTLSNEIRRVLLASVFSILTVHIAAMIVMCLLDHVDMRRYWVVWAAFFVNVVLPFLLKLEYLLL